MGTRSRRTDVAFSLLAATCIVACALCASCHTYKALTEAPPAFWDTVASVFGALWDDLLSVFGW